MPETGTRRLQSEHTPSNVDELWSQLSHALDTIKEILKTLENQMSD